MRQQRSQVWLFANAFFCGISPYATQDVVRNSPTSYGRTSYLLHKRPLQRRTPSQDSCDGLSTITNVDEYNKRSLVRGSRLIQRSRWSLRKKRDINLRTLYLFICAARITKRMETFSWIGLPAYEDQCSPATHAFHWPYADRRCHWWRIWTSRLLVNKTLAKHQRYFISHPSSRQRVINFLLLVQNCFFCKN